MAVDDPDARPEVESPLEVNGTGHDQFLLQCRCRGKCVPCLFLGELASAMESISGG